MEKKVDLLCRKGVYSYDWMDSFDKFNQQLPEKEAFFSKLNNENISEDDFQHAKHVWKEFTMSTIAEYQK